MMGRKRIAAALVGATALLGAGAAAIAGAIANDDFFRAVPGSTLKISVRDLLGNDRATRPSTGLRFVRVSRLGGDLNDGIKSFSYNRRTGIITVKLRSNFSGPAGLAYTIQSTGRGSAFASARIRIRVTES